MCPLANLCQSSPALFHCEVEISRYPFLNKCLWQRFETWGSHAATALWVKGLLQSDTSSVCGMPQKHLLTLVTFRCYHPARLAVGAAKKT